MQTYRKKMLKVLDSRAGELYFSMSSPMKISRKAGRAFSLPAGPDFACPGATEACEDCYATKGRHVFSNVQKAFARNWKTMKHYEKANDAVGAALELSSKIPRDGLYRIHESGDFHSQFAVHVWSLVVANNHHINFWAYTRSFDLNYVPLLDNTNFRLWASTDDYNVAAAKRFVKKYKKYGVAHAYGPWDKEETLPENSFVCPATSGKLDGLGACETCKLCVLHKTPKSVVFLKH